MISPLRTGGNSSAATVDHNKSAPREPGEDGGSERVAYGSNLTTST